MLTSGYSRLFLYIGWPISHTITELAQVALIHPILFVGHRLNYNFPSAFTWFIQNDINVVVRVLLLSLQPGI